MILARVQGTKAAVLCRFSSNELRNGLATIPLLSSMATLFESPLEFKVEFFGHLMRNEKVHEERHFVTRRQFLKTSVALASGIAFRSATGADKTPPSKIASQRLIFGDRKS